MGSGEAGSFRDQGLNCLLVGSRLSYARAVGGFRGSCGNPGPRAGWPVPPGLGRGSGCRGMGNRVGKGRNLKPCRRRGPSPHDPSSAGDGTRRGRGARGGRRTGRGQEGKALAKASEAESESAGVAQAEAAGMLQPPAPGTWELRRGSRDTPVSARQKRRPASLGPALPMGVPNLQNVPLSAWH